MSAQTEHALPTAEQADWILSEVVKEACLGKLAQLGFPAADEREAESLWGIAQTIDEVAEKTASHRTGPYSQAYQALQQELKSRGYSSEKAASHAQSLLEQDLEQSAIAFAQHPAVYGAVIAKAAALASQEQTEDNKE